MNKFLSILMVMCMVFAMGTTAFAAESNNTASNVVSFDENTGVTIYRDAAGGLVFSGLDVPFAATENEQKDQ